MKPEKKTSIIDKLICYALVGVFKLENKPILKYFLLSLGIILLILVLVFIIMGIDKVYDFVSEFYLYYIFYFPLYNTFKEVYCLPFIVDLSLYTVIIGIFLILGIYSIRMVLKKKSVFRYSFLAIVCFLFLFGVGMVEGNKFVNDWKCIIDNEYVEEQVRLTELKKMKSGGRYSHTIYRIYSKELRGYNIDMNVYQYKQLLALKNKFEENNFPIKDIIIKVYYLPNTHLLLRYELMENGFK